MEPKPLFGQRGHSGPIRSVSRLCRALSITRGDLCQALRLDEAVRFQGIPEKRKPDGTVREIYNPHPLIRKIQRRLVTRLLSRSAAFRWPDHLYGSIPNVSLPGGDVQRKDYVACARRHCGAKSLLKLDIKNFFGNVHGDTVLRIFQDLLGYGPRVSKVLACLCTHKGSLPQGGLTSSYLAMLSLHDLEGYVVERLRLKSLVYTRYVDDITISSKVLNYDFGYAFKVVENMLIERGLPLNVQKTKIERISTSPLMIHGLRIAFDKPRLPADEVGRIRASVRYVELLYSEASFRFTSSYRKAFNRCLGRVNKLKRVEHSQHKALLDRLLRVRPMASQKDLVRAHVSASKLAGGYSQYKETYGYHRRYYLLQERLNLIQRTYPRIAKSLRSRLSMIRPEFN
jgi:RNA-directed DNA polymerase